MFRGISNDQSLEDTCPSFARAAAAYRETELKETTNIAPSPVEKLRTALGSLGEQLASFVPGSTRPGDLVCQLAASRPTIVAAMREIAASPETIATHYRLTDDSFDKLWEKSLKVTATLDTLLTQGETTSGSTIGELHGQVLDSILEINRATARHEAPVRAEETDEADTPVSISDARKAAQELEEWGDDTRWTTRGL